MKDNLGWDLGVQLKTSHQGNALDVSDSPRVKLNALQSESFKGRRKDYKCLCRDHSGHRGGPDDLPELFLPSCFVQCVDLYLILALIDLHNAQHIAPAMLF